MKKSVLPRVLLVFASSAVSFASLLHLVYSSSQAVKEELKSCVKHSWSLQQLETVVEDEHLEAVDFLRLVLLVLE